MAFHPYPQLIPPVFNLGGCGPPRRSTAASTWPWVDHPASGLCHATKTPPGLGFPTTTPQQVNLATQHNSQAHSSIGTPPPHQPPKGSRGSDGLKTLGFRNYFTPLPGYFSPFPHGTNPLSVTMPVQAYPMVWADSHEIPRAPRYSGTKPNATHAQPATRLSRSTARHPNLFTSHTQRRSKNRQILNDFVPQPRLRNPCRVSHANGLANTRYRSPLHTDYLTKGGTKMFHFPPYQHTPIKTSMRANHTQLWSGYPIRKPPDQRTLANSPRLSPATTSFIGTRCQGIHQTLKTKNKPINKKHQPPQKKEAVNEQDSHKKASQRHSHPLSKKQTTNPKNPKEHKPFKSQ